MCYTDTDSFITHTKTEDFCKDITYDVDKRFDTSNCECNSIECNKPQPIGKKQESDELGGWQIKEFAGLRGKTYSCSMDEGKKIKKIKEQKNV